MLKLSVSSKEKFCVHIFMSGNTYPLGDQIKITEKLFSEVVLGGGVLNDLSHELDLVTCFEMASPFGDGGKLSDLEIDSEDCFSVLLSSEKCKHITVHLNYLNITKNVKLNF